MSHLVSVVIPAYNAERFIGDALRSVFRQTHRKVQILVVNDGSTDRTAKVCNDLAKAKPSDMKFEVIDIGENRGASNALSVGFAAAAGDYICWLSADDVWIDPKKLEVQLIEMRRQRALWSYFIRYYMGPSLSGAELVRTAYLPRLRPLDFLFVSSSQLRSMVLFYRNPISASTVMIDRVCVETYGSIDRFLGNVDQDGDLWLRYSLLGLKVAAVGRASTFYRIHGGQTSRSRTNMIYGSELVRLRMLLTLRRIRKLRDLVAKFRPFLVYILVTKQYKDRPFTTQFLCQYIMDEFDNLPLYESFLIQRALVDVKELLLHFHVGLFFTEVEELQRTPEMVHFQRILGRRY
jgi:glycosyltransferase involved in cell wall biosynthesis